MREMKDSGVEWIGKIPKDWEIVPLTKQLDSIVDYRGKTPEKTEEGTFLVTAKNIKDGKICYELSKEYVREADYEEIMHRGIPQIGDILFTTEAPLGQVANVDRTDIALAQRIIKFRALSTVNNYYLKYWMLNEGFQQFLHSLSTGSTATGIKSSKLFLLPLVRPNIEQQNKIVEYLDAKCSKIDEIVEKQKVIIEKLEEYKLSIITEAVTSGINPDVEMKDSGSVWFGNIPINWEMKRLKYVFHIQKDIAGEEGHTVLSITQRGIIPKDFSNNEGQFANSYANYQLVHKGDFAMNHMDLLTGWVDISKYEGVTSPDYRVFVLNDKNGMCPKYYLYMMQMCYSARIFYGLGQGVSGMGRWRLQADKFLNFYIPTLASFNRVYAYITQVCRLFDKDIHRFSIYSKFLYTMLPKGHGGEKINIDDKVLLEYYKLEKDFEGPIELESTEGGYTPISGDSGHREPKKDPLTVIIDKINEKYGTHFTEMDKVLVQMENDYANQEKWQSYAKNNDRATFMLLFEKDFPNMAADRYEQNDQFFRKLFDDPDMMRQVMETVGSVLYERLKKKYIFDPKSGVIEEATPETYVEDTYLTKK